MTTEIIRFRLPGRPARLSCHLRCDGCGRASRAVASDEWTLEPDLARLVLACRRRGWRRRVARTEDGPVRADYCRACCARLRRASGR